MSFVTCPINIKIFVLLRLAVSLIFYRYLLTELGFLFVRKFANYFYCAPHPLLTCSARINGQV